jgi:hypothetical protein
LDFCHDDGAVYFEGDRDMAEIEEEYIGKPGQPGQPPVGRVGGDGGTGGDGGRGMKGLKGDRGDKGSKGVSGEDTFMTQSLWFGWQRWTWVRLAYLFVVLAASSVFYRERRFEAREAAEAKQELIDKDYIACKRGNDTRQVIRDVVALTGGPTDLTRVPGYEALDPELKQFLVNLRDATSDGDESAFKRAAYALLVIRNCEKEFPGHTKGAGD